MNVVTPGHTTRSRSTLHLARHFLLWERPVTAMWLAFAFYLVLALATGAPLLRGSTTPYFNYLADAFLHGQLSLRLPPPSIHDLVIYQNQLFLYWPPFPAILLMPLVAVFGVGLSDVLVTLVLAAANVGLVALLLRYACARRVVRVSRLHRALLVLFFATGTVHVTLAPFGRVWAVGQLVTFTLVLLSYLVALACTGWRAFVLCGAALAGAMLTRNHTVLIGVWPALYLLYRHRGEGAWRLLGYTMAGAAPILCGGFLLMAYNWMRFGSVLDNGLAYHNMSPFFVEDFKQYGVFNVHYVLDNLYYQFLHYPLPFSDETLMGGSLFLLSPVFIAALVGWRGFTPRWSAFLLVVSSALVMVPIMLLMGTGWMQFGPRYTLDFTVPLLLLTASGARRWRPSWVVLLTAISFLHYLIGTAFLGLVFN